MNQQFHCWAHTHRGNQNWKRHVYPSVHHSTEKILQYLPWPKCWFLLIEETKSLHDLSEHLSVILLLPIMAIERQLPKWRGTHEVNGEVRVLLTATAPQPISLPSLATSRSFTPIMLSPFLLAFCTSVSWVSFLVLERLCFLLSQGCGCLCLQWSPPSASSVLAAQLRNHLPVRAACPGSCPGQVLCHVSSMRAWLSFWLLSASRCALGLGVEVSWEQGLSICVFLPLQCPYLMTSAAPMRQAVNVF